MNHKIDRFLTQRVETSREIVGCVFFSGDQRVGGEETFVGTSSNLVDHRGLQINDYRTRSNFFRLLIERHVGQIFEIRPNDMLTEARNLSRTSSAFAHLTF